MNDPAPTVSCPLEEDEAGALLRSCPMPAGSISTEELSKQVDEIFGLNSEERSSAATRVVAARDEFFETCRLYLEGPPLLRKLMKLAPDYRRQIYSRFRDVMRGRTEPLEKVLEMVCKQEEVPSAFLFTCENVLLKLVQRIEECFAIEAAQRTDALAVPNRVDIEAARFGKTLYDCEQVHKDMAAVFPEISQLELFLAHDERLFSCFHELCDSPDVINMFDRKNAFAVLRLFLSELEKASSSVENVKWQEITEALKALDKAEQFQEKVLKAARAAGPEQKREYSFESLTDMQICGEISALVRERISAWGGDPSTSLLSGDPCELQMMGRSGGKVVTVRDREENLLGAIIFFPPEDVAKMDRSPCLRPGDLPVASYYSVVRQGLPDEQALSGKLLMAMAVHMQRYGADWETAKRLKCASPVPDEPRVSLKRLEAIETSVFENSPSSDAGLRKEVSALCSRYLDAPPLFRKVLTLSRDYRKQIYSCFGTDFPKGTEILEKVVESICKPRDMQLSPLELCETRLRRLLERMEESFAVTANHVSDYQALELGLDILSPGFAELLKGCRHWHQDLAEVFEKLTRCRNFVTCFDRVCGEDPGYLEMDQGLDILKKLVRELRQNTALRHQGPSALIKSAADAIGRAEQYQKAFFSQYEEILSTPLRAHCTRESLIDPRVSRDVSRLMMSFYGEDASRFEKEGGFALEHPPTELEMIGRSGGRVIPVRGEGGRLDGALVYFAPDDLEKFDPQPQMRLRELGRVGYAWMIALDKNTDKTNEYDALLMSVAIHFQRFETAWFVAEIADGNGPSWNAALAKGGEPYPQRLLQDDTVTGEETAVSHFSREPSKVNFAGVRFVADPSLAERSQAAIRVVKGGEKDIVKSFRDKSWPSIYC